jgi:hypothetical protein
MGVWRAKAFPKTTCVNGHAYQEGPTRVGGVDYPNGTFKLNSKGYKECLVCRENLKPKKNKTELQKKQEARLKGQLNGKTKKAVSRLNEVYEDVDPIDDRPVVELLGTHKVHSAADLMPLVKVRKGLVLTPEEADDILSGEGLNTIYQDETGTEYTGKQILEAVETEFEQYLADQVKPTPVSAEPIVQEKPKPLWLEWISEHIPSTREIRDLDDGTWQTLLTSFQEQDEDELDHATWTLYERCRAAVEYRLDVDKRVAMEREEAQAMPEVVEEEKPPVVFSDEMVYFSLNCKIPLNMTGEAVKQLMDVLVSVGAKQIQL